jgi:hypothetical protein
VQPGQTLVVRGDVLPGAKRFEVNFLNDSLEINPSKGSVPLHISVRFDEGEMVLNSLQVNSLILFVIFYNTYMKCYS